MGDGYLNKCIECVKKDNKTSNGNESRICLECNKPFKTRIAEVNRGGGLTCSRDCYYTRLRKIIKKGEDSPNWKGDKVGQEALHNWVQKHLGKPSKCEHCKTTKVKKFEWANISQKYKRDLKDWVRLCTKCHAKFDRPTRYQKWKKAVELKGWNVKIKE